MYIDDDVEDDEDYGEDCITGSEHYFPLDFQNKYSPVSCCSVGHPTRISYKLRRKMMINTDADPHDQRTSHLTAASSATELWEYAS